MPKTEAKNEFTYGCRDESVITMSMKPMRSTGMTGQSSRRGMCVTPKTYLEKVVVFVRIDSASGDGFLGNKEAKGNREFTIEQCRLPPATGSD